MPNTLPSADDDILDLIDMVVPGKAPSRDAPRAQAALNGNTNPGTGFGADLDALLDSLGAEEGPSTTPASRTVESPVPAPIADPTPVNHKVNPHEELKLPELSDIDSLLQELGVADAATPTAPPVRTTIETPPAPAKAQPVLDDLPNNLAATANQATPKAVPPQTPASVPVVDNVKSASVPQPATVSSNDSIDLNELDALLDTMLATAPVPGPAPTVSTENDAPPQAEVVLRSVQLQPEPVVVEIKPEPAHSAILAGPSFGVMAAALTTRLDTLEKSLDELRAERETNSQTERGSPNLDVLLEEKMADLTAPGSPLVNTLAAALAMRLDALEKNLDELRAERKTNSQTEEKSPNLDVLLEEKLADLAAPDSSLVNTLAAVVTKHVLAVFTSTDQVGTDAPEAVLRQALDKSAAAAAAKVIREEIAALLQK